VAETDGEGEEDVAAEAWAALGMVEVTSTVVGGVVGGVVGTTVMEVVVGMLEVEEVVGRTREGVGVVGESMDATTEVSPPSGSVRILAKLGVEVAAADAVGVVVVPCPVPKILENGFPSCL